MFTFLLFLSGYVLQQQTVRSLQDALRNPPEKLTVPTPVLPPQFQKERDEAKAQLQFERQIALSDGAAQTIGSAGSGETSAKELWHEYVQGVVNNGGSGADGQTVDLSPSESEDAIELDLEPIISKETLAYLFTLSQFGNLCSAALFAKQHRATSRLLPQPQIVFLYPATWDVSDDPAHVTAMDLLREMQDSLRVTLHPVTISRVWAGIGVEMQLLSELQRYRWSYGRAMYLGSPGMMVDTATLDRALALSDTKASWTLLHANPKSYEASHPSILLWYAGRGLLYPRQEMRLLTSRAGGSRSRSGEVALTAQAKDAAYVLFDQKELERMSYDGRFSGNIFERFERDRQESCSGTGLID